MGSGNFTIHIFVPINPNPISDVQDFKNEKPLVL